MWWFLLAACKGTDPAPLEGPTYWADVEPILTGRCVRCHADGGVAPYPMDSYAAAAEVSSLIAVATAGSVMPPWFAEPHRAYQDDPSLTDAQLETLSAWDAAGAPEGDPSSPGEPIAPVGGRELPRVDVTLALPVAYEPVGQPGDDYRCFVLDWPEPELSYVTGFAAAPDNGLVVHHMAAFLVRDDTPLGPEVFDTFAQWDDDAPGPGYTCFGGPSGSEDLQIPIQQIAQWVPGSGATLFPEGTGIPVPPGSKVVLQMHYFTGGRVGELDQSSIDLMTAPSVERVGAFAPYLNPAWPLVGMSIPADGEQVVHAVRSDPLDFLGLFLADIDISQGFDIHGTMMHMHRMGRRARLSLHHGGVDEEVLLEVTDWDFDWQLDYRFAEPATLLPGDELDLACTFVNDTEADASWGEGSEEEMCVANMYISER